MTSENDDTRITVDVQIDPRRLVFDEDGGIHTAALHVAVFVGDKERQLLGEKWETLDLRLDQATFARIEREDLNHAVTMEIVGAPRYVKAVVYDYLSDRLGTAERTLNLNPTRPAGSRPGAGGPRMGVPR